MNWNLSENAILPILYRIVFTYFPHAARSKIQTKSFSDWSWKWIEIEMKFSWSWMTIQIKLWRTWHEQIMCKALKLTLNWIAIGLKLVQNWIMIEIKLRGIDMNKSCAKQQNIYIRPLTYQAVIKRPRIHIYINLELHVHGQKCTYFRLACTCAFWRHLSRKIATCPNIWTGSALNLQWLL